MPRPKPKTSNSIFSLRLNDELKYRLEVFAYVEEESISGIIHKAILQYLESVIAKLKADKNKLDDIQVQLIRNIVHQNYMNKTGELDLDYSSKKVTQLLNEFFTLPVYEEPSGKLFRSSVSPLNAVKILETNQKLQNRKARESVKKSKK